MTGSHGKCSRKTLVIWLYASARNFSSTEKRAAAPSLARRELSLTRTRRIEGVLSESVAIESYSDMTEALEIQLGLLDRLGETAYLEVISAKTAQLFAAACRIGAERFEDVVASVTAIGDDQPDATQLRHLYANFDAVCEVGPAGADVGAEHVRAVALVVHASRQRDRGIRQIVRIAEHVNRLASDRRQKDLEVAARDELRVHAAGLLEQRATQVRFGDAEALRHPRQPPHRFDRGLGHDNRAIGEQDPSVGKNRRVRRGTVVRDLP